MKREYIEEAARILKEIDNSRNNLRNLIHSYGIERLIVEIKDAYGNGIYTLKITEKILESIVNDANLRIDILEDSYKELEESVN